MRAKTIPTGNSFLMLQAYPEILRGYILSLQNNPLPHDSKKLVGYEHYMRIDIGEYRIIYRYQVEEMLITVVLVGKRNDDQIYKIAKRNLK